MHLAASLAVATAGAALVFGLWFPWPYRTVSGGIELFILLVGVDVVEEELPQAPERLRRLSLVGPRTVTTARPREGAEQLEAITMALAGADLGVQP